MSMTIPTDPDQITAEIADLLATTPETTDRGRLFHLLNAAMANAGGGGGLPMSAEGVINIHTVEPTGQEHLISTMDFGAPYGWYQSTLNSPLVRPEGGNNRYYQLTPMITNDNNSYTLQVGAYEVQRDDHGTLFLRQFANTEEGNLVNEWSIDASASPADRFAVCSGMHADYGALENVPYVVRLTYSTTTQVKLNVYKPAANGALVAVAAETTLNISSSSSDVKRLRLAVCRAGQSESLVINVQSSSSDKRTLALYNTTTGAVSYIVENEVNNGRDHIVAQGLYSYNPSAYGFVVSKLSGSTQTEYEVYSYDGTTAASQGTFTLSYTGVHTRGYLQIMACDFAPDGSGNYGYLMGSPHEHSNGVVPYATWQPDSADVNKVTSHTVDLTEYLDSEYRVDNVTFLPDNDYYRPYEVFFVGLRHKSVPTLQLIRPTSKTAAGSLPLPQVATHYVLGYSLDDYIAISMLGNEGYVFNAAFEAWAWYQQFNNCTVDVEPQVKIPVVPNYLGAPLVHQPNEVTVLEDNNRRLLTYLPKDGGVICLDADGTYTIPSDAPVGAAWTLTAMPSLFAQEANKLAAKHLGILVAEFDDSTVANVCSLNSTGATVGNVALAIHIVKTAAKAFKVTNLV
ncbi:hypothetical protein [Vibrio phage V-YDF132]|nr:hypothetical protein [Vibrio phage V-YDF132]